MFEILISIFGIYFMLGGFFTLAFLDRYYNPIAAMWFPWLIFMRVRQLIKYRNGENDK